MSVTVWPPEGEDAELLGRLAGIIERGGAARFLDTRLVAADTSDFPEPWQPTRAAIARLIAHLLWHAHVELALVVDDGRVVAEARPTRIDWLKNRDGAAVFRILCIGNDDVVGALVHEIGCAYLASLVTATPYRGRDGAADENAGSVAAVYLGLGVLVANAATHRLQAAARGVTSSAWMSEPEDPGALTTRAATFLLAVQAVARDHRADALRTLAGEARAELDAMIDELRPHRAELLARLRIDPAAPRPPLARAPAPVVVRDAARPERRFDQPNAGRPVARIPHRLTTELGAAGAATVGALVLTLSTAGVAVPVLAIAAAVGGGGLIGGLLGRRRRYDVCASCHRTIPLAASTCPGCSGTARAPD